MKKLLIISFLMLMVACETSSEKPVETSKIENAISILQEQGFHTHDYQIDGDYVILESDMRISIDQVLKSKSLGKQWRTPYLVDQGKVLDIKVKFDSNVPSEWKEATRFGFERWNEISDCKIEFFEVAYGEDMVIKYESLDYDGAIAMATFPSESGDVGEEITINTNFDDLPESQKNFTMTHELGHCLGFRHTNWFDRNSDGDETTSDAEPQLDAEHIPGTPEGLDPNSVMNAIVDYWNGFSEYDEVAARYMYPEGDNDEDPEDPEEPEEPEQAEISGPDYLSSWEKGTYTAPEGNSYQWWYKIDGWWNSWTKWDGVTSRSVSFSYYKSLTLAVVVNGEDIYYKEVTIY
jgi:hypothetical protein